MEKRQRCHLCHLNHPLRFCKTFKDFSVGLRLKTARVKGFCLNCLAYDHFRDKCISTKRCAAIVNGQPCNGFHHTLLHPEETKRDVPAKSLREKPVADQASAVTSPTKPVADQASAATSPTNPVATTQAAIPQPEDTKLAAMADELHLEETPNITKQAAQRAVKKVFANSTTQTPTRPKRILVSQATQTPPRVNRAQKASTTAQQTVSTQTSITTSWPVEPIVRVNLNFGGQKMFTAFLLDRTAKSSYILWDVAKLLPEFKPIRIGGEVFGRFILEPSFPHAARDSFTMDLPIRERLNVPVPDPILDSSLLQHFRQYKPLAHPFFDTWRQIDGVLGRDVAQIILKPDIEQPYLDVPIAQASTFGWIISGVWRGCSCHS